MAKQRKGNQATAPPENWDRSDRYRPIEDYAVIGNGLTLALVARDGSIDWACFPRFDSPSVFARLLDADTGGHWQIAPEDEWSTTRQYVPDTNVLATTFATSSGEAELVDFMPLSASGTDRLKETSITRIVRGRHGEVEFRMYFEPRFDYARTAATWTAQEKCGVRASHADESLTLHTQVPLQNLDGRMEARFTVRAGEDYAFVLTHRQPGSWIWLGDVKGRATRMLEDTIESWRRWIGRCAYRGQYEEIVHRSALTLKLLDYAPTGAIIAAGTTSLPEEIGGVRNWDYRYCWIRDTAFTLYALYHLGYREEGEAFLSWIADAAKGDPANLQVLYGVAGEHEIDEYELPHLEGYRGSRPVRIGNGAYDQLQLDIYGDILDSAFLLQKHEGIVSEQLWEFLRATVDHVCQVWTEPDEGIWEVRSGKHHFVYSKAMCWVALDRGIKIAREGGLSADLERWEKTRDEIHAEFTTKGYNVDIGALTQSYGSTALDAAALSVLLRKALPANDPRMRSTVDRVAENLGKDGLLHRYLTSEVDDGLEGDEGVFLICSFWLADCYVEMGRLAEARELFERLLGYANDVGLFAEQLDPEAGHQLGNFPQAFTHIGLINVAVALSRAEKQME